MIAKIVVTALLVATLGFAGLINIAGVAAAMLLLGAIMFHGRAHDSAGEMLLTVISLAISTFIPQPGRIK